MSKEESQKLLWDDIERNEESIKHMVLEDMDKYNSLSEMAWMAFYINVIPPTEVREMNNCIWYDTESWLIGVKIIAISTMETEIMSSGISIYTASKSALESFCITMAREYAKRNIIINGIRPAYVNTDMAKNAENIMPEIEELYPFGLLQPDDVANVLAYLLSDEANNFTGKF